MHEEVLLEGGIANRGAVVRVGDTVRRPVRAATPAVRALLEHLESAGFAESPRFLGIDDQGREVLSYIPGEVGVPPYPEWAATDSALLECAGLLSRYHEAVASFEWQRFDGWCDELGDPGGEGIICHNDICVENVVFRDGVAVGLIDFDFAAPGAPLWDVGATARMWAPLVDPAYRPHWPGGVDEARRLGLFARAFGVGPDDASAFVDLLMSIHTRTRAAVRRRVERGEPAFVAMWNAHGGEEREGVDLAWLDRNRAALVDAVARGGGTD